MQFVTLRLTGFKSFVEPTELAIEPGITGVVGPNGCGKSNLVEALRWVMGEASAKSMRGAGMDDVIFGGTHDRPARNIAEVTLTIDNSAGTAPSLFDGTERLDVMRRIERGAGSDYRVNGRSVRARDVQLLFQDNATGAGSPALVGQGRVGALIAAKPSERRVLLEEAAGIVGLHGRRHEAELRLRAAENNLLRLDDVIGAMETQLAGLKKQARQAARYRSLSDRIRQAEAVVLYLRWADVRVRAEAADHALRLAEASVAERTAVTSRAAAEQAEAAAALPPLRQAAAEAAAAVQRLEVARAGLAEEERRVAEARGEAERRLAQITRDVDRERSLAQEAENALARLDAERQRLVAAQSGEERAREGASSAVAEARDTVSKHEADVAALTERVAADEARRDALARRVNAAQALEGRLAGRWQDAVRQHRELESKAAAAPSLDEAEERMAAGDRALEDARAKAEQAEADRLAADQHQTACRTAAQTADAEVAKLTAEANGIRSALAATAPDHGLPSALDAISVAPGYEAALAAGLGEAASASLDPAAPLYWHPLPPPGECPPWPDGVEPLADKTQGPEPLRRRLTHIGVVDDPARAPSLLGALRPGQRLVSRDGRRWHWDGLVALGEPAAGTAARLRQRNRMAELDREIADARARAESVAADLAQADDAQARARGSEKAAREAARAAAAAAAETRDRHAAMARDAAARSDRLSALNEAIERLAAERSDAERELAEARTELAGLADPAGQRTQLAETRAALAEHRAELGRRQAAFDAVEREAAGRRRRLDGIARDRADWQARATGAGQRLAELDERADEARATLDTLARRPAGLAARLDALLDEMTKAEATRREAGDRLVAAEGRQTEADRAAKAAESALSAAREQRVRAEAEVAAAETAASAVRERVAERLQCRPDALVELAGMKEGATLPEAAAAEARLDRLLRERDSVGPVNLRADTEASELQERIDGLLAERKDLVAAIGRLRHGISSLNKEARERLLNSFETVDKHFQSLFARLFGGGRAHLRLTEAEDPLDAGLEIMASPPGKRLQHLSLLSGGEQTLTATALLFAVFLTNPAPICVLDEVDAPLDDANVDRFCSLLEDLAHGGSTRFLVITHHRMTMARVDRLFGVTMPEKGISQLVSVDLDRAVALRESA